MNDALIRLLLIAIAGITVLSGASQLVAPGLILGIIATSANAAEAHLFATVGMFMVITGALFLQSLLNHSRERTIPFWIGVQKLAAAVLVGLGWSSGLFAPIALGVAGFDAVSGALCFVFWRRLGS